MRVKIEEIQGLEPLTVSEAIKPETMADYLADAGGFSLARSTPLTVTFKRVSGRVLVRGGFVGNFSVPCKRCLKDETIEVPVDFSLRMVEEARRSEGEDVEAGEGKRKKRTKQQKKDDDGQAEIAASFELDEIDAEPFDGKTIDLDPIVREQVLLALPVAVVCREDCKGLCTVCGQNLNESDCGHAGKKEVDVRLAKLKDIKLKN
jgi:uncharacterized protein